MKEYIVNLYNTPLLRVVEADNEEEALKKGREDMLKDEIPESHTPHSVRVWEVVNELPNGWKIDKGALTAPRGYEWIYNGKGFSGGRKSKLMRVEKNNE